MTTVTTTAIASTSTGTTTGPLYASLVEEAGAGEAPALVEFSNETAAVSTLQLGGAEYWQLDTSDEASQQLAVSADVPEELRLGWHETKSETAPCTFLDFFPITGAPALVPGLSYDLVVTGPNVDELAVDVVELGAAEPYVALRTRVDATVASPTVELVTGGRTLSFSPPVQTDSNYQLAGDTLTEIRFTHNGGMVTADLSQALDNYGYTVVVSPVEHAEALISVPLE